MAFTTDYIMIVKPIILYVVHFDGYTWNSYAFKERA
jgi:hypothetical protein